MSGIDEVIIAEFGPSIISQTPIAETGVINALSVKRSMNKRAIVISIRQFLSTGRDFYKFNKINALQYEVR